MTAANVAAAPVAPMPAERARRITRRRLTGLIGHAYVWLVLSIVFALPFLTLLGYSVSGPGGTYAVQNFQYVLGSFGDNLWWSFRVSGLTLLINVLVALPAAYPKGNGKRTMAYAAGRATRTLISSVSPETRKLPTGCRRSFPARTGSSGRRTSRRVRSPSTRGASGTAGRRR